MKNIRFVAGPAGKAVVDALNYLHMQEVDDKRKMDPPITVVTKAWEPYVMPEKGKFDRHAYMLCTLDRLKTALDKMY